MTVNAFAVRLLRVDTDIAGSASPHCPLLLQNENGPCFVIALVNALLLRSERICEVETDNSTIHLFKTTLIELASSKPSRQVSVEAIYSFLVECIMEAPQNHQSQAFAESEANTEILNILPLLNNGLQINPAFDTITVSDFDSHTLPINAILAGLRVELYHGFLMPQSLLALLKEREIKPTFNTCQDYLVAHLEDSIPDSVSEQIKTFLTLNSTEFTNEGHATLMNDVPEDVIFILFRNDHYNTCIKHNGKIHLLVTDIGYLSQQDIVWTELSVADGGNYFDAMFEVSKIGSNSQPSEVKDYELDQQEALDMLLAQQLQSQEDELISRSLQKKEQRSSQLQERKSIPQTAAPKPAAKSTKVHTRRTSQAKDKSSCTIT